MNVIEEQIRAATAVIPDFPEKGVSFIDITTVLKDPDVNKQAILSVANLFRPNEYDIIISPGARGWLLAQPIAWVQRKPLILARDPAKLPRATISAGSKSEYAEKPIAFHVEDVNPGDRVLIIDDVSATRGTAMALTELIHSLGAKVIGLATLYDLPYLKNRVELPYSTRTVITYETPPEPYIPAAG